MQCAIALCVCASGALFASVLAPELVIQQDPQGSTHAKTVDTFARPVRRLAVRAFAAAAAEQAKAERGSVGKRRVREAAVVAVVGIAVVVAQSVLEVVRRPMVQQPAFLPLRLLLLSFALLLLLLLTLLFALLLLMLLMRYQLQRST